MSDPIEFLEARIGEDEEWAQVAAHFGSEKWSASDLGRWEINDDWQPMTEAEAQHIARHDPARVLAECAAKREILAEHAAVVPPTGEGKVYCRICVAPGGFGSWSGFRRSVPGVHFPCRTVLLLTLPYTSHPDYDPAWRD